MNSDPHESAAWRTFGMLDSEEASAFDETMRHDPELRSAFREMDRLASAVAVTATTPIAPRAGQLERLHLRLGLVPRKRPNWLGITGWAAAACLALLLVIDRDSSSAAPSLDLVVKPNELRLPEKIATASDKDAISKEPQLASTAPVTDPSAPLITDQGNDAHIVVKVETKRLIQEIEVLREKLETFQQRDRQRFEPMPGMAWPIVMRMLPPGKSGEITGALASNEEEQAFTAVLGDALASSSMTAAGVNPPSVRSIEPKQDNHASATPIYDPARRTGTLVVNNLPAKSKDEAYNLWVHPEEGGDPVHVGRLPDSTNAISDSFDFTLVNAGVVPAGFVLTKDLLGTSVAPGISNTVLQGPN